MSIWKQESSENELSCLIEELRDKEKKSRYHENKYQKAIRKIHEMSYAHWTKKTIEDIIEYAKKVLDWNAR